MSESWLMVKGRLLWGAILFLWVTSGGIAIFASETILLESEVLSFFVTLVSAAIDPTQSLRRGSDFPQITALYYSIVWLSVPFWVRLIYAWFSRQIGKPKDGLLFKTTLTLWNRGALLALLPIWVLLLVGFLSNHGGSVRLADLGTSRIHLALFGMAFPMGFSAALCLILFSLKRIFRFDR